MLQAPFCVLAVLPALIVRGPPRLAVLAALLALLLPSFVMTTWKGAVLYTRAGLETKAMVEAVHAAIPANDGWANVIDDVPTWYEAHPMMGGYFETGISDSYGNQLPPIIARSEAVLASPQYLSDVLRVSTRYWRYDIAAHRLVPIERDAWLKEHPQAQASLPQGKP
jgi:hypothetical protein